MLCVIVVLILLTGMLATGTRLASDSYDESVSRSEGEILCSTLVASISDELRFAGNTEVDEDGNIKTIFSQKFGELNSGFSVSNDGQVLIGGKPLLADKAYTYGLKVTTLDISYEKESYSFQIDLILSRNGSAVAEESFTVKPVNTVKIDA